MANTLGIDYAEDLSEMVADCGHFVTISDVSIPCVAGDERRGAEIEGEAALEIFEREVVVESALLSAIPEQNSTATIGSQKYFVYDVRNEPENGVVLLYLRRYAENSYS